MADDKAKLLADHDEDQINPCSIQVQDTDHSGDLGSDPAPGSHDDIHQDPIESASDHLDEGNGEEKKSKPLTFNQKLTFAGIACMKLASPMSFAVLAPFFPYEAAKKGVTPTQTGLVFGIFALCNFIASPIWGKFLPVIGGKFMFLSGCFVAAGCNLLFGFLDKIEGKTMFLTYCFVIRIVESLGFSAANTAGISICAHIFPDNIAQMIGILDMFGSLGFTFGPPLGSFLYGIGGYKLPFIVLGCTTMTISVVDIFILPSLPSGSEDKKTGSMMAVLRVPAVWIVLLAVLWGTSCLGFTDPTLSLHLTSPPYKVHPSVVGYVFLLIGGINAIFSPLWGFVADKKKATRIMMVIGFWISGISFMLIGPSPLLHLPSKIWIVCLSLALFGFSLGLALMPSFVDLLISVKWYGLPEDLGTQAIVSGLYSGVFALGTFVGPTLGGALVNHIGFDWSSTYFAGGCFAIVIIMSLFGVWEYQCGKGRRKPIHMRNTCIPYPVRVEDAHQDVTA